MQIKPSLPSFGSRGVPSQLAGLGKQGEGRAGNALHQRSKKKMQDMQTALTKMQELQKNSSAKNMASQRAALLKQRLDTLKSIMAKLPPGNYKALAQELKQIAKELAGLSKKLGNSGGNSVNVPTISLASGQTSMDTSGEETTGADASSEIATSVQNTELATSDGAQAIAASAAKTAQADAQQAANLSAEVERDANTTADEQHDLKSDKPHIIGLRPNEDADDKSLRAILTEARKSLKEVVSLLKVKHQVDDKESRKLFASIDRDLDALDQSLKKGALASLTPEAAPTESIETGNNDSMGGFVNISV